jgi:hypothetical protein
MQIIKGADLEISIESFRKLDDEIKHKKQEKKFYDHLFKEGNTVSLYISGCPALILVNIIVKKYTENVWNELCHLIIEDEKTESEFIKLDYINNQPGFNIRYILRKCMY